MHVSIVLGLSKQNGIVRSYITYYIVLAPNILIANCHVFNLIGTYSTRAHHIHYTLVSATVAETNFKYDMDQSVLVPRPYVYTRHATKLCNQKRDRHNQS